MPESCKLPIGATSQVLIGLNEVAPDVLEIA